VVLVAEAETVSTDTSLTVIVMVEEVAGLPVAQVALEVIIQ
jgi:hypothetical protein